MPRARTRPKALRAVGGSSFKLWDSKEKLTGPNTLAAVRKTKGLRNSREEPAHPRWRKEAGGGARGKLSPREATPSHTALQNSHWFLSKDFLRPDRRRALGPRREKAHRARGQGAKPLAARPLAAEGKGAQHLGRGRQNCWLPGQNTASAPHTQRHLPAAPHPPRSRTELN